MIVSAPDVHHHRLAAAALRAGKHTFVEKSFVQDTRDAEELVSLAAARGLTLMVGYVYQYDARFAALRRALDAGVLGPVVEVDLCMINRRNGAVGMNEKYGVSVVHHHVTHLLSVLQALFGLSTMSQLRVDHAGEDDVRLRMRYGDVPVRLTVSVDRPATSNYRVVRVRGEVLAVALDYDGVQPAFVVEEPGTHRAIRPADPAYPRELAAVPPEPAVARELREMLRCIETGDTPASGGEAAIRLVELGVEIDRAYQQALAVSREDAGRAGGALDAELAAGLEGLGGTPEQRHARIAAARRVLEHLGKRPFAAAEEMMRDHGVDREELRSIYRAIQRSPAAQGTLERGAHHDYLNVARMFFEGDHFEATFFVGLACPYKCSFCRMVEASIEQREGYLGQGDVDLRQVRFDYGGSDQMPREHLGPVLDDLARLRDRGRLVTVKVSGGLEPLSDPRRVQAILDESDARGLPVKIYTNGILARTPGMRGLLLRAREVRISLNALHDEEFQRVYLSGAKRSKHLTFEKIRDVIEALVAERRSTGSTTRLGINFVVVRDNIGAMEGMAELARDIGIDFVNYNADYCGDFDDHCYFAIRHQIDKLHERRRDGALGHLSVGFGGALLRENVFATPPAGAFDPVDIRHHKVFIDLGGLVTPIHEGTYPVRRPEPARNPYVLGSLRETTLLQLLNRPAALGRVEYKYLAPFELILGLEALRESRDAAIGLTPEDSPYRRPPELRAPDRPRPEVAGGLRAVR